MSNVTGPFNLMASHTVAKDGLGSTMTTDSLLASFEGAAVNDAVAAPEASFDFGGPSGMC